MGTTKEVLEKLKGLDGPKLLAVVDGFGGRENLEAWLRGEKRIILEDIIRKLLDHTGRCIPAHLGVTNSVCDENRDFHIELSEFGYAEIRERLTDFFPKGTEFASANEFKDRAEALNEKYAEHELIGNFFKRARPILLPKHDARENYGASLQDFILPAVERAYKKQFPERKFVNYRDGKLVGKVSNIPGTAHDELVLLMAEKSVAAWYSPNPFQGFSIFAQREAMKILMQYGFALAGGVDTGTAAVAYMGEMARDFKTPVYTCSSLSWQSVDYSLCFRASDDEFYCGCADDLADAYDRSSGGLVLFR